jgi:hypothetical protein
MYNLVDAYKKQKQLKGSIYSTSSPNFAMLAINILNIKYKWVSLCLFWADSLISMSIYIFCLH